MTCLDPPTHYNAMLLCGLAVLSRVLWYQVAVGRKKEKRTRGEEYDMVIDDQGDSTSVRRARHEECGRVIADQVALYQSSYARTTVLSLYWTGVWCYLPTRCPVLATLVLRDARYRSTIYAATTSCYALSGTERAR
eukprot:3940257-Rhodomonas_salina.4